MRNSSLRLVAAALLVSALAGCSSEPRARVFGKVTLQGVPLRNKVVLTFVGTDHVPLSTQTDETGAFSLTDLPVGETRVTIVSIPEGGPQPRRPAAPQAQSSSSARLSYSPPSLAEVPAEYGDAANPKLKFALVEGDNDLSIDLVSSTPARRNVLAVP
jgi:hypothetical protein